MTTRHPNDGTPVKETEFVNNDNDGKTTALKDNAHPFGKDWQAPMSVTEPVKDIKPALHADNNPVEETPTEALPEEEEFPDTEKSDPDDGVPVPNDEDSDSHVN